MRLGNYLMTNIIQYNWHKMTVIANVNVFIIRRGLLCKREQRCFYLHIWDEWSPADLTTHGRATHAVVIRCMKFII